jgi:protein-arginine kinase activator protein McsA
MSANSATGAPRIELSDRMRTLTENLQKAVKEENYETAAYPRQISALSTTVS